jgi:predicted DNA-binding transcriptional regulator YafY
MADTGTNQAARLIFMLKKLQNGYVLSAEQMLDEIRENFKEVSLRTVQRDLRLLQDSDPTIETKNEGRTVYYFIPRQLRERAPVVIGGSDLLSLHILKAHLKTFKGTVVEELTKELTKKIEEIAPANVYSIDSLYWNKNIGQFDYFNYDKTLRQIIYYIEHDKWVKLEYCPLKHLNKSEIHTVKMKSIFTYFGYLYVAAYDIKHKKYVVFAVHRIESIEQIDNVPYVKVPKFDYNKFVKNRFGVYGGQPENVVLRIKPGYAHYFENRYWHITQKLEKQNDGSTLLKLRVPIVPDFISWIISWGDMITVETPNTLKRKVIKQLEATLKNYNKGF